MNKLKILFNLIIVLISMTLSSAWTMQIIANIYDLERLKKIGIFVAIPTMMLLLGITIIGYIKRKE